MASYDVDPESTREIYDSSTGMYNFGFRHYNQSFGRFMSEDPLGSSANLQIIPRSIKGK